MPSAPAASRGHVCLAIVRSVPAHGISQALHPLDRVRLYRTCVRLDPHDIEGRMELASTLALLGDSVSASSAVSVLLAVLARPVNEAARKDAHNMLAVLFDQAAARLDVAEQHLRAALAIDPAYTPSLVNLGNCLWKQQGRREESLRAFLRAQVHQTSVTIPFHYTLTHCRLLLTYVKSLSSATRAKRG